ncbi:hypothetical protein GOBAR_AA02013 [Gossypium barbadense]|uniref:DUF1308 domain-containing protein n=1 Tax=Gossypium barbadense TaxID=3634 RepID=A0A2P5YSI5_GOSBA|nr:hypothetical protein GOBAR_AA02013 [Gossypium barbadense]
MLVTRCTNQSDMPVILGAIWLISTFVCMNRSRVMRDSPLEQLIGLPTTRKLALKNKIVFGTGDYWCAPTLTANMAFVRAVA